MAGHSRQKNRKLMAASNRPTAPVNTTPSNASTAASLPAWGTPNIFGCFNVLEKSPTDHAYAVTCMDQSDEVLTKFAIKMGRIDGKKSNEQFYTCTQERPLAYGVIHTINIGCFCRLLLTERADSVWRPRYVLAHVDIAQNQTLGRGVKGVQGGSRHSVWLHASATA